MTNKEIIERVINDAEELKRRGNDVPQIGLILTGAKAFKEEVDRLTLEMERLQLLDDAGDL